MIINPFDLLNKNIQGISNFNEIINNNLKYQKASMDYAKAISDMNKAIQEMGEATQGNMDIMTGNKK